MNIIVTCGRQPWNKGKLVGKRPVITPAPECDKGRC